VRLVLARYDIKVPKRSAMSAQSSCEGSSDPTGILNSHRNIAVQNFEPGRAVPFQNGFAVIKRTPPLGRSSPADPKQGRDLPTAFSDDGKGRALRIILAEPHPRHEDLTVFAD